jgi:integrase
MQHKHVEIIRDDNTYLRLSLPESKKHSDPVVTMERAVNVYEELKADRAESEQAAPDDYVFMPEHSNRDTALRRLQQLFNYLLDDLGLKTGARGEERTIYSLRHTCIMHRLLEGDKIDVLTLARNARTSVEMIERFYASKLNGEMNIEAIQSMRRKSKDLKIGNSSKGTVQLQVQGNSLVMSLPSTKNSPLNLE